MNEPSVTAVMVTGKHPDRLPLARRAIDSFLAQSYPHRDLLIINDGLDPVLEQPCDHVRELQFSGGKTLGELRNVGIEKAIGDFVIQWDDDDWYRDDRISTQVEGLVRSPVVCLRRWIICDILTGEAGVHDAWWKRPWHAIEGTVLFPRATSARYPASVRGEDSRFLAALAKHYRVTALDNDPCLYVHTYHGRNTWDRDHILRQIARPLNPTQRAYVDEILDELREASLPKEPVG